DVLKGGLIDFHFLWLSRGPIKEDAKKSWPTTLDGFKDIAEKLAFMDATKWLKAPIDQLLKFNILFTARNNLAHKLDACLNGLEHIQYLCVSFLMMLDRDFLKEN
ncbi:hypothetical protein ACJX0J_025374, partial [Zea mays]